MTSSEMIPETGASRPLGVVVRRGDGDAAGPCPPPSSRVPSAHPNTIIGLGEDFIDELRLTRPWIKSPLPPRSESLTADATPSDAKDEASCSPIPPLAATAARCSESPPPAAVASPTPSVTPPPPTATVKCKTPEPTKAPRVGARRKPTAITLAASEVGELSSAPDASSANSADNVDFRAQFRGHVRNIVREFGMLTVDVVDAVERWLRGRSPAPED